MVKGKFSGAWCWLLPLTYLIHIAEEYGGGFPAWVSAFSGASLTPHKFLVLNAVAWGLMVAGVTIAYRTRYLRWLVVAFGLTVAVNGTAHVGASLLTQTYSPGLVSGVLLWWPLGGWILYSAWSRIERRVFWWGVGVGLLLHAGVTLAALYG
jgi:hypothetical protein